MTAHDTKEAIHDLAQADVPRAVDVPNTMTGIVMWFAGRFGIAMTVAVGGLFAMSAALKVIYTDLGNNSAAVLQLVKAQTEANVNMNRTVEELARQVGNNSKLISDLQLENARAKTAQ